MNLATSRVGSDIRRIVKTWGTSRIWQRRSDPNFRQTDLLVAGETKASESVAGFHSLKSGGDPDVSSGRYGRRVFEANQHPIVRAMELFECMPLADAEKMLVEPLTTWLKDSPGYDPEGWSLSLLGTLGIAACVPTLRNTWCAR